MALATNTLNVYVAPEDGWKQVVAAGTTINYLAVKQFPCNHGVYIYIGASQPTELGEVTGFKLDGEDDPFVMNVVTAAVGVWVRCPTPAWGGGANSDLQKTRLDVVVTTA